MPLSKEQEALLDAYQARVTAMIERSRASRDAGKSALADRQLEMCVDIYREYAMAQADIRFKVSYLCGTAVRFAVQMGMHQKAHKVMSEAERLCPQDDTELIEALKRMRETVDKFRAANYHPLKKSSKAKQGRLH
jgi:hypothetical protein